MFWKKEKKEIGNDRVKCETCKCWLSMGDAQEVKVEASGFGLMLPDYYCLACKKPYCRKLIYSFSDTPLTKYFAVLEVYEDGDPVGYKKLR